VFTLDALLETELFRWKRHWQPAERPTTVSTAVKLCSKTDFPNVHVLLRIACTLPVTSCECERSANSLRRLHIFTRTSMAQDRLSSLALIHIHYDTTVDLDEVVRIFYAKKPRRMQLTSILCD
jgi:hAT family C-terminal dimerisation region